jgi:hypothetical protein
MIWVTLYLYVMGTINVFASATLLAMVMKQKPVFRWRYLIWPVSQPVIAIYRRITRH